MERNLAEPCFSLDDFIDAHVHRDPEILSGKPVIRGTRIPVYVIIERMQNAVGEHDIAEDYPSLSLDDIRAALAFHLRHQLENSMDHLYQPSNLQTP